MYKTRMSSLRSSSVVRISQHYAPSPKTSVGLAAILRSGWVEASPGRGIRRDKCPGDDVLYCLSGRGQVETGGETYDVKAGQLIWIDGSQPHAHLADDEDPWSVMWFRLACSDAAGFRSRALGEGQLRIEISQASDLIGWFQGLFDIMASHEIDTDLHLHAAVARFLQLISSENAPSGGSSLPPSLLRLTEAIRAAPHLSWSEGEMVDSAQISASQIRRLFRQHMDSTPRIFLRRERITMAQSIMLESTTPLYDIAQTCGFFDAYHLSRDFRRFVGRSPKEWREMEIGV
jgi:AraC-like DNA-binding protein/mannose-6-phosphate isomerase-like protein (cupin superfamily)